MIQVVWDNPDSDLDEVYLSDPMGRPTVPNAVQEWDPISGGTHRDDGYPIGRTHGRTRANVATSQTPIPTQVGGGDIGGPLGKHPAMMAQGGDVVGQVYRSQRYPAIAKIRPETTGTIGSVARQSYQFVRSLVPYPFPSNAFGNPNIGGEVRQIDQTIPPALEPPRYDMTGLDTNYLQQQHDTLLLKARLVERG